MKIIVTAEYCNQVGPDSFDKVARAKICNENTTIGEIQKWANKSFVHCGVTSEKFNYDFSGLKFSVVEEESEAR